MRYQNAINQFPLWSVVGFSLLPHAVYCLGWSFQPRPQSELILPTRYLKPGICDSEAINRASPMAETLWYRLLVNVDDFGRIDARPAVIRSKCYPLKDELTNAKTLELLIELQSCGLIFIYESNGCSYIQMQKWDNVPRSKESKCPAYDGTCAQLYADVCSGNTVLPVTVTVTKTETVKPELKPETGTETKDLPPPAAAAKKATRLPADWQLPKTWGDWALAEFPSMNHGEVRIMADTFRDHWLANASRATGKKDDWYATWRNWVRKNNGNGGAQFLTASQRRMAVTDKSIAEWLAEDATQVSIIEGEFNHA